MRSRWVVVFVVGACGKSEAPAVTSGRAGSQVASGSAPAAPLDAAAPVVVDAAVAAQPACVPMNASFGKIGSDLVACGETTTEPRACWTIDRKTGALARRPETHLPGVGFTVDVTKLNKPSCYEDLCWTPPKRDADHEVTQLIVAYHPDGKRVAVFDDPQLTIFDLATKRPTQAFQPSLGNMPSGLWFAGDSVMVSGSDAGPYAVLHVYSPAGKQKRTFEDLYEGGVGIVDDRVYVQEGALGTLTVLDGTSKRGKTTKRKIPKPPCKDPHDPAADPDSDDPKERACIAYTKQYFEPYVNATVLGDGAGFIGMQTAYGAGDHGLFTLDAALAETSRINVARCREPDDDKAGDKATE
ncbi:MAG TPA: hypothetical protein VFQ53_38965 [Kofleriaceae bacterium]|nr:hypothetical protein [Kofleriaceae bacterium]